MCCIGGKVHEILTIAMKTKSEVGEEMRFF